MAVTWGLASATLTAVISIALIVVVALFGAIGALLLFILNGLRSSIGRLTRTLDEVDAKLDRHLTSATHSQDPQVLAKVWGQPPEMRQNGE